MIKFFRHIRKKLLSENKFSKYLIYAIGEIILVVIGIMIALQFNNRNEQRKNLNLITETITALEEDLIYNFDDANFVLNFYKKQDKICKQVLLDKLTIEDYRNNDLISILVGNWETLTPKSENLAILIENEKSASVKLRPIIEAAKELTSRKKLLDEQWAQSFQNIKENINTLSQEVSLIRLDSISKEKRFEYMLTNDDYKKVVEMYWINLQLYSDQLSRYRASTVGILSTIKMIQENYDKEALETLYASLGMSPFIPLNCPTQEYEKNDELRVGYLIVNVSDQDVKFNFINDGKIASTRELKPNAYAITRSEFAGIGGDYTVIAEQVDASGNCLQKFLAVNKGYLLIE